jgi:hypothetical protein
MVRRGVLTVFCCLVLASTCFADKAVNYVRNGTFGMCPYRTVGDAVGSGLENARWSSGTATDGQTIVNVEGMVTWDGKRYRAVMQFGLKPNKGFDVNGVAFNGKLMSTEFKQKFIKELCK